MAVIATEAEFENRGGTHGVSQAADALIGLNINIAIGIATGRTRDIRRTKDSEV